MKKFPILFFAAAIIFCAVGVSFYFFNIKNSHYTSSGKLHKKTGENADAATQSDSAPVSSQPIAEDSPIVLSPEYKNLKSNSELVERARNRMATGSASQKIRAFHVLMEVSPTEASTILRDLIPSAGNADDAELVAYGLVGFAKSTEYLPSYDVKSSYAIDNKNVQKIAALIMQDRGDDSLVKKYMETTAAGLHDESPLVRSQALRDIASVGFDKAVPYALESLKDSDEIVKRSALDFLLQYGTSNDISKIEPLLNSSSKDFSQYAQEVINVLWKKNTNDVIPLSERLVQPGFPDRKSSLDLEE